MMYRVLFLFLLISVSARAQQDSVIVEESIADTLGIVYLDDDSIFSFYTGAGDLTVKERATWVSEKLNELTKNIDFDKDSIHLAKEEDRIWIFLNEKRLFNVSEGDAAEVGLTVRELAEAYSNAIISKLEKEAWWKRLRRGVLRALGAIAATLILYFVYKYLNRWFRKLRLFLKTKKNVWFTGFKIKKTTLLTPEKQLDLVLWLLVIMKWFIFLFFGYLYLPIIFSFFPWTKGLADKLFGYVLHPLSASWQALVDYLPNLFAIAVIVVIAYYINKTIKFLAEEIKSGNLEIGGFYSDWADTTYKLVNIVIIVFTITVIWPYIPGSDSDAFKGISIFVGVLFSLGSTGAISNIVSGTVITYMRPFAEGDRVKIADTVGTVVEKSLLVTRIRTPKNVIITIPNGMVLGSHIINYSNAAGRVGLVLHTNVTIGYDVPWKDVHEALIAAANEVEEIIKTPEPFVLQKALSDFYVDYELNAYTKTPHKMERIYSRIHQAIQDKFNEAGIEIMSPHYSSIRDGNEVTIPKNYRGDNYQVPSFLIKNIPGSSKSE